MTSWCEASPRDDKLAEERVRELIAASPFSARDALKHGLIDAALYEDELEQFLDPAAPDREESKRPPVLAHYDDVRRKLLVPYVRYAPEIIGVVSVEGMIVEGRSLSLPLPIPVPFFGSRTAGSDTVAEALRRAESDDRVAAVILYVNSSGGSALASDLIAREVKRVRTKKPVVAYMAGVAASGGYYVAAPANAIVAQSLTITGSIGVVVFRPNASGAYDKLHVHRAALQRGGRTGLLGVSEPLTGDEQQAILEAMARAYADFKRTVSEGRKLDDQALEPSCGGRVWTGAMAKERRLVDEVGDFTRAVDKARELAGLPAGVKMRAWLIPPPHKRLLPPPFLAQPAQWQWLASPGAALARSFSRARVWAVLPWQHDGPTD